MHDSYERVVDYLRVSVTDRCNLRCLYCLPAAGIPLVARRDILSLEELEELVRVATENGIRRVRITGGEPLLRRGLVPFLARVRTIPGLEDLSLTTNGLLLEDLARDLRQAGVDRLNLSLDSLRPDRYREITRGGDLAKVWRGLERAAEEGFAPIKLNVVLMRRTVDELPAFLRLTLDHPWHIRFIELMPIGEGAGNEADFLPAASVWGELERWQPVPVHVEGGGPATSYQIPGAIGTVGFIAALSHNFCDRCRRIRLGANGVLYGCLTGGVGVDLRTPLRQRAPRDKLGELFRRGILAKPKGGDFRWRQEMDRAMSRIGG